MKSRLGEAMCEVVIRNVVIIIGEFYGYKLKIIKAVINKIKKV